MKGLGILLLLTLISCKEGPEADLWSRQPAGYSDSTPSKWKGGLNAFPLRVEIGDAFDNDEITAIDIAGESWGDAVDNATEFFDTSDIKPNKEFSNLGSYRDSVMGIYKLNKWPSSLSTTALAVTQLFGYRKDNHIEIHHADILVNNDMWSFKTTEEGFGYDLQTVIVHELGHFIGLYHDESNRDETVMFPSISSSDINRVPKIRDIQKLKNKYSIGVITPQSRPNAFPEETSIETPSEEEEVSLILELNADGNCKHYLNGELIHEH